MLNSLTPEVREVTISMMEGLSGARALTVAILVRYREWPQLFSLSVNPKHYCDPQSYARDAFATEFLRKFDADLIPGLDLETEAIEKWRWSEAQCYRTNCRLDPFINWGSSPRLEEGAIFEFFEDMRKAFSWLVGPCPPSTWDGAFGPGATQSDRSGYTTMCHKMSSRITLTTNALFHLVPWTGTKWAMANVARVRNDVSIVRGNKFFTVPKTAVSLRGCAKEPSLNAYYQLGLGRCMRKRLKSRGIDLDYGQSVHRRVACEASKTSAFVTIDLTSASDCVATALVELVATPRWHDALCSLRSPFTEVNGRQYRLEKFSSMGNGFTFELETALFTAICLSASRFALTPGVDLFVYGDDIIVPAAYSEDVIAALRYCGFTPNVDKTHVDGYFRESCGGDFFDGVSVRAHYLKEELYEPQQFISLANGIRRLGLQDPRNPTLWPRLRRSWFKCLDNIPSAIRRCRGPEALGDIVIHDAEDKWNCRWRVSERITTGVPRGTKPSVRFIRCYRPHRFKGVGFDRFDAEVQFAAALHRVPLVADPQRPSKSKDTRRLILRNGVTSYKVGWVPFS